MPHILTTTFRASILLSFATLALGLAAGGLKVTVNAVSSSVSSIDDIVLTAVVSNPTGQDIRVIGTNNVLDNLPTKSFFVTKDDQKVTFTGAFVREPFKSPFFYLRLTTCVACVG